VTEITAKLIAEFGQSNILGRAKQFGFLGANGSFLRHS